MNETFTLATKYENKIRTKIKPFEVEGEYWTPLVLASDWKTKKVPDSLPLTLNNCYAHVCNGNHWILTKSQSVFEDINFFFKEKINDSWVETEATKKEKEDYLKLVESSYNFAICCDGHKGVSKLVELYSGNWFSADFTILTQDSEKVKNFLVGLQQNSPDEELYKECFASNTIKLPTIHLAPEYFTKNAFGRVITHPSYTDEFTPKVIGHLPSLSGVANSTKKYKSEEEKAEEVLTSVASLVGVSNFTELYHKLFDEPTKVQLAFALHKISLPLSRDLFMIDAENWE